MQRRLADRSSPPHPPRCRPPAILWADPDEQDTGDRDERRLAELGRQVVEVFVAGHMFESKIQAAYREAAALRLQEELLKEEEEFTK